jgi:hypothetical protein
MYGEALADPSVALLALLRAVAAISATLKGSAAEHGDKLRGRTALPRSQGEGTYAYTRIASAPGFHVHVGALAGTQVHKGCLSGQRWPRMRMHVPTCCPAHFYIVYSSRCNRTARARCWWLGAQPLLPKPRIRRRGGPHRKTAAMHTVLRGRAGLRLSG